MLKIQLCITGINYILKYIHIENSYFEIIFEKSYLEIIFQFKFFISIQVYFYSAFYDTNRCKAALREIKFLQYIYIL